MKAGLVSLVAVLCIYIQYHVDTVRMRKGQLSGNPDLKSRLLTIGLKLFPLVTLFTTRLYAGGGGLDAALLR